VPSGQVHNTINTLSLIGLAGCYGYAHTAGWVRLEPSAIFAFAGAFVAGTYLLSPDLDLAEQNVSSKKNWGLLGFLWVPYGWLFSHRGMSHTWLVGPFTRLFYLGLLMLIPVVLLRQPLLETQLEGVTRGPLYDLLRSLKAFWRIPSVATETLIALGVGYYVSQWLHLIADGVAPDTNFRIPGTRKKRRR
jgi:uncharacterized metal-binding protein